MLYPTHLLGGAAAGLVVAHVAGASPVVAAFFGALGALLPDLDTPQSKASGLLRLAIFAGAVVVAGRDGFTPPDLYVVGAGLLAALSAPRVIARLLGHRGATHSALVALGLGAAAIVAAAAVGRAGTAWVFAFVTVGYLVGGLAHDACTVRGVPLLWPLRVEKLHLVPVSWRLRTGSVAELGLRAVLALVILILLATCFPGRTAEDAMRRPAARRLSTNLPGGRPATGHRPALAAQRRAKSGALGTALASRGHVVPAGGRAAALDRPPDRARPVEDGRPRGRF